MWKQKASRLLAVLLAVLLLSQAAAFQTLAFAAEDSATPVLQNGVTVIIPSDAEDDEVANILYEALVENKDQVSAEGLKWEYYCTGYDTTTGLVPHDSWVSINGGESYTYTTILGKDVKTGTYKHDPLATNGNGDYDVRIGENGTVVTIHKYDKLLSSILLNEDASVKLVYNEDLTVNYDAVRQQIWGNVVDATDPELTLDDVTIEYYATATTGSLGSIGKNYAPLQGGQVGNLTYPAMGEGTQTIRISYPGTDIYTGFSKEVSVTVLGRPEVQITLKEGPYEVGMVFNDDLSYNYDALKSAIFNAVVESTDPILTVDDVTIEYDKNPVSIDGTTNIWSALSDGCGIGSQKIRISWSGTTEYKDGNTGILNVNIIDNRIASTIVYKEGATITYNMDPEVMKQDLFENAIDWSASTLPADASIDDFSFEYYATAESGTIGNLGQNWAPIEGGTVSLLTYPQMGAGENQQVRISYKGNAEYRPVQKVEGTVTVNKATVKVTVHSTSIYPDESIPDGFVTLNPNDPAIDIYTIYAGLTSDVDACVYVQLPARLTDSAVLKILDPIVAAFSDGKTLTEMMQEGMTVGELRELLSGLIDALNSVTDSSIGSAALRGLGIDPEALSQMLTLINKLPGIADNVRVAFGTPNRAGLYTVIAVTSNENYETAYGMGMLLVKMRVVGVKLEWNQDISKLTVEEAATADFGAHVTYNGEAVDSDNVHYLYSGITSSWRIYSSTTTAPTEPGRYTVTVVTLGGSYLATPLTRSFQITK